MYAKGNGQSTEGRQQFADMFGDVLREARESAGMTQEDLAFEANLNRTYISHLENNKKSPTLETIFRLGDALRVPPSTLVARAEQMRNR